MKNTCENILSIGVPLEKFGVQNFGLTREQALSVLDKFRCSGIAILGGDVYRISNGKLEPTYDNWYCDRENSENIDDYTRRSIQKANEFISSYSSSFDLQTILFVFAGCDDADSFSI